MLWGAIETCQDSIQSPMGGTTYHRFHMLLVNARDVLDFLLRKARVPNLGGLEVTKLLRQLQSSK